MVWTLNSAGLERDTLDPAQGSRPDRKSRYHSLGASQDKAESRSNGRVSDGGRMPWRSAPVLGRSNVGKQRRCDEIGRSMRLSCSQRVLASECSRRFSRPGYRSAGRRSRLAIRTIRSQASNSTASSFRPLPAARSGTRVPPQIARAFWATRPPNGPEVATGGGSSPQSSVPGDHPTAGSNARAW